MAALLEFLGRRFISVVVSAIMIGAMLAACGGDDDGMSATTPGGTGSTGGAITDAELHGKIVYISNLSGNRDVWVMNADGSDPQQITRTPQDESFPEWSPDGTRIAYQTGLDIYVMDEDGSNPRLIVTNGSDPTWSPDGKELAYSAVDGTETDLAVVNVETKEAHKITNTTDVNDVYPDWSPDGSRIVFFSDFNATPGLYTIDPETSDAQPLTSDGAFNFFPAWSADGEKVAYAYPRGDIQGVALINKDGTGVLKLTDTSTYDSFPAWSPDGCCIAFLSTRVDQQSDIFVMRPDGSGIRRITQTPSEEGVYGMGWKP